jgi:hypothetical protein
MTVILGRSDVAALLDIDETIAALDAGFRHDQQVAVPGQRARRRRSWYCWPPGPARHCWRWPSCGPGSR